MNIARPKGNTRHGFALVELLVAISIIVILSVSLLFQQSKFDSSVQITNVAYDIALAIQEAQTYSKSAVIGDGASDDVSYGVHFVRGSDEFIFYRNNDVIRGYTSGDEIVERYTITGRTSITDICSSETGGGCGKGSVSISFMRPNPEPTFSFSPSGGSVARIVIENDDVTREIIVTQTGQIKTD
ncbi:MAG: type II secretion system protein [Candidatus Paceibacterota bacterium]